MGFMKGNKNVVSGILATEIAGSHGYTDHFPTFCIIDLKVPAIFQEKADFAPW